jgi:hypothetical protein
MLKSTILCLPVYGLLRNASQLKQATSLEEQEIIEMSISCDYKLNFNKASLRFPKAIETSKRSFRRIEVEGVGRFEVRVEYIGTVREILGELKSTDSKIMNMQEEQKE